ncbi:hypothetical protein LguiB_033261 [Lonicera macranthoides]
MRTAPIPSFDESVSTTKVLEKSGRASTGVEAIAVFNCSNASVASGPHLN